MTVQKTDIRPVRAPAPCDVCGVALDVGEEPLVTCTACRSTVIRGGGRGLILSRDGQETALAAEARPAAVPLYQMGQFLGRGAFATVYAARYLPNGEQRAIKFLHSSCPPEQVRRFRREVQLLKRAESRHILKVFELGVVGRHTYIALELITGGSLRDRLEKGGRMEVAEAVELTRKMLLGLEVLHQFEIIHRDLKPENVLVGDEVKIADLGVAMDLRTQYPDDEPASTVVGTPLYMAPEQMDGKPTPLSDLYAAGAILHEMLTGVPPKFTRTATGSRSVPLLVPPSQHAPWLNGRVQALLLSALSWDPKNRPRSAAAFRTAIEELGQVHASLIRSREAAPVRRTPPRVYSRGSAIAGLGVFFGLMVMTYGAVMRSPLWFLSGLAAGIAAMSLAGEAGQLEVSRKGIRQLGGKSPVTMSWDTCRTAELDAARGTVVFRYGMSATESGTMRTLKVDMADLGTTPVEFLGVLCEMTAGVSPAVHARARAQLKDLGAEPPARLPEPPSRS